jgi:hypothetical protein
MEDAPITKICLGCGVPKILDDFYKQELGRHGRSSRCKKCFRNKTKKPDIPIFQFDIMGELVNRFDNMKDAIRQTGFGNKIYHSISKGSLVDWRYYFSETETFAVPKRSRNPLLQGIDKPKKGMQSKYKYIDIRNVNTTEIQPTSITRAALEKAKIIIEDNIASGRYRIKKSDCKRLIRYKITDSDITNIAYYFFPKKNKDQIIDAVCDGLNEINASELQNAEIYYRIVHYDIFSFAIFLFRGQEKRKLPKENQYFKIISDYEARPV